MDKTPPDNTVLKKLAIVAPTYVSHILGDKQILTIPWIVKHKLPMNRIANINNGIE